MSENEDESNNELDNNDAGDRLAEAVGRLDKTQHIKPTVKAGVTLGNREVSVNKLLDVLNETGELADVGRNLKNVHKHKGALVKPLEKGQVEKIKRSTGFEEVRAKLDRWNAIVARNRAVEHKEFPLLDLEDRKRDPHDIYLSKYKIASDLEKDLEALNPTVGEEEEVKHFPLTMAEMIEHRKEAARLRAKQSYKEAKARRQSKIKSKKFHRIQRKERIKSQLKEFEALQKTNPEEALKKLEQLEKTRAEERVTLRHKSTGQWAKNKLVRAKYDKDTRQQLAQQLAISRELTQKLNVVDGLESEDEHDEDQNDLVDDSTNPWLRNDEKNPGEYSDFVGGYKKFWEEQNKTPKNEDDKEQTIVAKIATRENVDYEKFNLGRNLSKVNIENTNIDKRLESNKPGKVRVVKQSVSTKNLKSKKSKLAKKVISTTEWEVSVPQHNSASVDDMFDELNLKLIDKFSDKLNRLKTSLSKQEKSNKPTRKNVNDEDELSKLSFKTKKNRPIIDEELFENSYKHTEEIQDKLLNVNDFNNVDKNKSNSAVTEIDPSKFVAPKPRYLQTTLPDAELGEDHMDDDEDDIANNKQMTIAEAFEDDDIVTNFEQEKKDDIDKNKLQIDDSFLPGWGSWTGKNLAAPKRKRRRFFGDIINKVPRKDHKKDNLIIKESTSEKLKSHMVSELPFPFTSVKDFESTIRAPIGNTFIPETAHKRLTKPAVSVKTGIVIKPMDESHLINLKNNNTKKPFVNKKKSFNKQKKHK